MQQDTQDTRHTSAVTQDDKELEERIKRALEGFATEDNLSRSARGLFRALGFDVVNEVSEREVSFESLYKRVQNKEANKRLVELLSHTEGCYYAGSLTPRGGEEYLASQDETVTQQAGDSAALGSAAGTDGVGTPAGGADTHENTGDTGAGSATDDTGDDEEEERDVHFFAVRLKDGEHFTRSQTADLVRGFNRLLGSHPGVVAIRSTYAAALPPAAGGVGNSPAREGEAHTYMTLGVCERSSYKQDWRVGGKIGKVRLMADVRCDDVQKTHRGHKDILLSVAREVAPLHTAAEVWQGLLRVFSVSLLTKRFYEELEGWYFWAVRQALFPNDMARKDDYTSENRTAIIRLITRFIFVWFIKQKGLVNSALFDEGKLAGIIKDFDAHSSTSGSYYNAIVQNLFFATLNQSIDKRGWVKDNKKEASDEGKGDWHPSEHYTIGSYYRGWDLFTPEYAGDGGKDSTAIRRLFSQTPYVNGSLFDRLDGVQKEGRAYNLDGFSSHKKAKNGVIKRAFLPNSLFFGEAGAGDEGVEVDLSAEYGIKHTAHVRGLIEILTSYYFTAEENTPAEEAVALDPELLGRVFENLLGAYNPETAESARKDSGSFYTPRAIVDYMTAQSLLAYFSGACPDVPRETLEVLLESDDAGEEAQAATLSGTQRRQVIEAVYSCRVLDPACGSGAFPMGVLQRLVAVLRALDKDNTHWREVLVQRAGEDTKDVLRDSGANDKQERIDEITATFERQSSHPDYTRKLYVIQRCIHGVDIQPIAIQISKLRFFISLLCEQQTNGDSADNYGIMALPNLETNLVAANTLVSLGSSEDKDKPIAFGNDKVESLKSQLMDVRAKHFDAHTKTKKTNLEKEDKRLRSDLALALKDDGFYNDAQATTLAAWNPYDQNAVASFFAAEWMFGIRGFDVVIGNPPYGAKYSESDKKYFKENYQTAKTIKGVQKASLDTFTLFIEKGFSLTNEGGCLSMIVPMSFTSSDSMAGVHKMLMSSCKELRVSSYAVRPKPIFENAVVNTSIFQMTKRKGECKHVYSTKMHRKGKGFELQTLIDNLSFVDVKDFMLYGRIPKIGSNTERSVLTKMNERGRALSEFVDSKGKPIYYRTTGGRYFKVVTDYSTGSTKEKPLYFKKDKARTIGCILSSNLAFWFYQVYSNNLDWKSFEILTFRIPELDDRVISRLNALYDEYLSDIERNANVRKTTGTSSYKVESFKEYKIGKSKAIIDRIDDLICPLYGFTQEETDFIKNYEIEFRLSDDE